MSAMASHITSLPSFYSAVYSGRDERKHQNSATLAFVRGIHPVTGEFPAQRDSNAENVSIWWRHHVMFFQSIFTVTWPIIPPVPVKKPQCKWVKSTSNKCNGPLLLTWFNFTTSTQIQSVKLMHDSRDVLCLDWINPKYQYNLCHIRNSLFIVDMLLGRQIINVQYTSFCN